MIAPAKQAIYCFDSSGILDAWARWYKPDRFRSFWTRFETLVRAQRAVFPNEVIHELERRSDGLVDWLKERDALIYPTDEEVLQEVRTVLGRYPKLIDTRTGRSGADPMVIATAKLGGHVVVTGERFVANASPDRPRIPNVCDALSVPWVTIVGVIEREDWVL